MLCISGNRTSHGGFVLLLRSHRHQLLATCAGRILHDVGLIMLRILFGLLGLEYLLRSFQAGSQNMLAGWAHLR